MEQEDETKDMNPENSKERKENRGLILAASVLMIVIYEIMTAFLDVFQRYNPLLINLDDSIKVTVAIVLSFLDLGSVIYVIWLINSGGFNNNQVPNARISAYYISAMFPLGGGIALIFLFGMYYWGGILGFMAIPVILLFLILELRKRKLEKLNSEAEK